MNRRNERLKINQMNHITRSSMKILIYSFGKKLNNENNKKKLYL